MKLKLVLAALALLSLSPVAIADEMSLPQLLAQYPNKPRIDIDICSLARQSDCSDLADAIFVSKTALYAQRGTATDFADKRLSVDLRGCSDRKHGAFTVDVRGLPPISSMKSTGPYQYYELKKKSSTVPYGTLVSPTSWIGDDDYPVLQRSLFLIDRRSGCKATLISSENTGNDGEQFADAVIDTPAMVYYVLVTQFVPNGTRYAVHIYAFDGRTASNAHGTLLFIDY